ncbi:MAG: nucleotidyl transferase AbiEii/AbiGii toxin family protein [Acidimicrobiaceae bacterium]|nr:nucleotidyl transferase AbiEii/AbiGii toxin family protein [Acidimicrobiaceae bacterium]MYJ80434.1 nucleotidyl transferase AbiEii/AbiGii toxin family protein [Acidimicrobiaceae bacterium]MYK74703.1 nucleotidyl transferase AbiEii/AbiGii toxin family protein [Acidimicrobiaceae bacterium]
MSARPIVTKTFAVDSPWFSGSAGVATYALEELAATKIRALFQRRKGRDLFDLWLAVTAGASPTRVAEADCGRA